MDIPSLKGKDSNITSRLILAFIRCPTVVSGYLSLPQKTTTALPPTRLVGLMEFHAIMGTQFTH
jgi:hypothetical protein